MLCQNKILHHSGHCTYNVRTLYQLYVQCTYIVRTVPAGMGAKEKLNITKSDITCSILGLIFNVLANMVSELSQSEDLFQCCWDYMAPHADKISDCLTQVCLTVLFPFFLQKKMCLLSKLGLPL